jgi:hypothetical protein
MVHCKPLGAWRALGHGDARAAQPGRDGDGRFRGHGAHQYRAILGFGYGNEVAQALFLLGFPLTGVGILSLRTAQRIRAEATRGEALIARISRHRLAVQAIGMVSIFVTAMWGMYQNMAIGPLG